MAMTTPGPELSPLVDKHGGVAEDFEPYWTRVSRCLPNFPSEVARQWFFDHPHQIADWGWLGFDTLQFTQRALTTPELLQLDVGDDGVCDTNQYYFEQRPSPDESRIADYCQVHGTWPIPPIFLSNPMGSIISPWGWRCASPFQILEGHHRLAILRSLWSRPVFAEHHLLWIATRHECSVGTYRTSL